MNIRNKVTIFVVTYNRVEYLKKAIDSILKQTYKDFILYVLDNCSNDGTQEYIASIKDDRLNYVRHSKNIGAHGNFSYAFDNCGGDYFAIFHDDDILHEKLLEEEVSYLDNHSDCMAVSSLANIIDEFGNYSKILDERRYSERSYCGNQFFLEYLNHQTNFIFPTTLYRTSFMKKNNIRTSIKPGPCADVVLYMDIERFGGSVAEIPKVLLDYRVYKNQDSSTNLETMLIQLISFFSKDSYYAILIAKDYNGRVSYFRWYFRRLLARAASNCIEYEYAIDCLNKMYSELRIFDYNKNKFEKILKICSKNTKLVRIVYRLVKGIR